MPETADLVYQETVYLARWVSGLILVVLVLLVGTLVRALLAGPSEKDRPGLLIGAAVVGVLGLVAWNYRAIRIRVTRYAFEARYGLFNRVVIPSSEITECHITGASFGRYLGVGLRLGLDGSWAYTTSFGPAVEVRRRSGRPFVVSTNRPQDLCRAINAAIAADRR